MKRLITILTCVMFVLSCGLAFSQQATPAKPATPATPATPAKPATPATPATQATSAKPEKPKVEIYKVKGEITNIDTTTNTVELKVTLNANTPDMQEAIKKLTVGKKVVAIFKKTEAGDLVLIKISEEKPEETKLKKEEKKKK